MSLLQPWMLWALPLIGLPVLIHLVHKRRHRVVAWGAMMFLLQGARMSKGMQRLRQILLLALRTIAVAGLIIGIGRPIAGGWIGDMTGGRPDAVIVLLDRSASMSERLNGKTKITLGVERVVSALASVEATRFACVDSVGLSLIELASPEDLKELPTATGTSASADLPAMLEVAVDHLRSNNVGRAEIWVCSDGQVNDWRPEDGRWAAIQAALVELPAGVRVNVLNFPGRAAGNLSIRVDRVERVDLEDRAELRIDFQIQSAAPLEGQSKVPVTIEIGGARSVLEVELAADGTTVKGHPIPIEGTAREGWGFVGLPADENAEDNRYYFTYGAGSTLETVIVAEDPACRGVLGFAAEAPLSASAEFMSRAMAASDANELDLTGASVLFWQADLPTGDVAETIDAFIDAGGQVLFLPPEEVTDTTFRGCGWGPVQEIGTESTPAAPTSWRRSGDLLRDFDDGAELPMKSLELLRHYPIRGDVTPLANLGDGEALIARAPTDRGGLYFIGTTPTPVSSNLANQGAVLVAICQRALGAAADSSGSRARQEAGTLDPATGEASMVSEVEDGWLLGERSFHAGVLQAGESFISLNRPVGEDGTASLDEDRMLGLLPGVEMRLASGGSESGGLVEEIWRVFLMLMLVALIGEALLCVTESSPPRIRSDASDGAMSEGGAFSA